MIPGFSKYEASSLGRLRSLNYKRTGRTQILRPAVGVDGYYQTMLQNDAGGYESRKVHWFVSAAFLGVRAIGLEVNHKDGVKSNNAANNLEYCTRSQNIQHSVLAGLQKPRVGSLNGMAKLTEEQVRCIRKHAAENGRYYGRGMLAKKYGVTECTIKEVVTRRKNKFYNA